MKIKPGHYEYEYMKNRFKLLIEKNGKDQLADYKKGLKKDPKVKDLQMRFRWDLLWFSIPGRWLSDNLYSCGIHDDHIDTALRRIVKELGL